MRGAREAGAAWVWVMAQAQDESNPYGCYMGRRRAHDAQGAGCGGGNPVGVTAGVQGARGAERRGTP